MRFRNRNRTLLLACIVLAAACGRTGNDAEPLAGAVLPAVRITDIDGADATIEAFRGRILVLNVWATWCGPCRRELPSLDRLRAQLDVDSFAVAGIAVDSDRIAVREYLLQHAIRFPNFVAVDPREIESALATRILPQTLLIAADGSLVERFQGARRWDSAALVERIEAALPRGGAQSAGPRSAANGGSSSLAENGERAIRKRSRDAG